jgi:hypothetical protein
MQFKLHLPLTKGHLMGVRNFLFSTAAQTGPGADPATQPPVQRVPGPFPGVATKGLCVDHPTPSSAEVKNE